MRSLLVLALLSSTALAEGEPPAAPDATPRDGAQPDVALRLHSTGREVSIDLGDGDARRTCTTPCELRVAPGTYRARVDGLDRTLVAGSSDSDVVIAPTLRGRQIAGIVLVALASAGLTFAGHWSSPLDDRQRVAAGLLGAGALGFAVPFVRSASTLVGTRERPSRADVAMGVHVRFGENGDTHAVPSLGIGYRPRAVGLGAELRVRGRDADVYQLAIGATLHGPALGGVVRPALAVRVGASSQRAPDVPADLASETPAMPGEIEMRGLVEAEGRIVFETPSLVDVSAGVTVQTVPDRRYAYEAGLHVRF